MFRGHGGSLGAITQRGCNPVVLSPMHVMVLMRALFRLRAVVRAQGGSPAGGSPGGSPGLVSDEEKLSLQFILVYVCNYSHVYSYNISTYNHDCHISNLKDYYAPLVEDTRRRPVPGCRRSDCGLCAAGPRRWHHDRHRPRARRLRPGAVANGLREKDLTLAVSLALKEELESYDGVRVVMTRTTDTRPSENISTDLSRRVEMAAAEDADALVSIHFNSGSPIAKGAEVWYANSSSYNYGTHTQGRTLSNAIQKQLTSLGAGGSRYQDA